MILCAGCQFWREGQDHEDGDCRRHAPRPDIRRGGVPGQSSYRSEVVWPVTHHSDGCGEGELRE